MEKSKWNQRQRNLHIGDLVLPADSNAAGNKWPLGRVVIVYPGHDRLVRNVEVFAKGNTSCDEELSS